MDKEKFQNYKENFINAFRAAISEHGKTDQLVEAAFLAYADPNPLIRFLFWRRLWLTMNFLESHGPYETVLDFGCGGGVAIPLLKQFSKRVIGLDEDLVPYRNLSKHIDSIKDLEVYETKEKPLSSFPAKGFDIITALDVLEHIENLENIFSEFLRVLKPGGMLMVTGPTESFFYEIGRKIAGKDYTGAYHVTNVYNVKNIMSSFLQPQTLATLYYPFPLFKIFVGYAPK
jgi:2-polyprenyl-3-methyl-5-hydroxy-6-metoxy-1,4-benzoquinol methylase